MSLHSFLQVTAVFFTQHLPWAIGVAAKGEFEEWEKCLSGFSERGFSFWWEQVGTGIADATKPGFALVVRWQGTGRLGTGCEEHWREARSSCGIGKAGNLVGRESWVGGWDLIEISPEVHAKRGVVTGLPRSRTLIRARVSFLVDRSK